MFVETPRYVPPFAFRYAVARQLKHLRRAATLRAIHWFYRPFIHCPPLFLSLSGSIPQSRARRQAESFFTFFAKRD